jgi:uncharacterized membrane protein
VTTPKPDLERERARRLSSPYTRQTVEWIAVVGFAGLVAAILAFAAAIVFWAWSA